MGPTLYPGLYRAVSMQISQEKDAHAHMQKLLHKFKQKCRQQDIPYQQSEHQGIPSKYILDESIFHDLVIVGFHTHFDFGIDQRPGKSLEKILDHAYLSRARYLPLEGENHQDVDCLQWKFTRCTCAPTLYAVGAWSEL